jgi:ubiquitin-activating enzyme E1
MITTTAFVSALSCVELVKLVQQAPLSSHRNAFINLALPFFAFTVPVPAERMQGLKGKTYTLWDRISIAEGEKAAAAGGLKMRSLIKKLKRKAAQDPETVEVASVGCGPYMLFANFLHDNDESVLNASIWDLIRDAIKSDELLEGRDGDLSETSAAIDCSVFADLTVVLEDLDDGLEVELPPVRVTRYDSSDH